MNNEKFTTLLKKYMRKNKITEKQLADALGVSRQAVNLWLKAERRPIPAIQMKIKKALKIPDKELLNALLEA